MKQLPYWLQGLNNPIFARLYLAQTINLVGDALTWVGLALLAFELAGAQAGTVLAGALTLRVTAFVVLSPIAGAIADRVDRKRLMVTTHLARMAIVCLLPFVTQVWQIYAIVLSLNVFYAFFAPTYTATIPLVTTEAERAGAIALSSATYQLLGVLGPGLAGSIAAFVGTRQVFFLDGITFLIATILIVTLPGQLMVNQHQQTARTVNRTLEDIRLGTVCLFLDPPIRYALVLQFVAAIAGAEILVNLGGLLLLWAIAGVGQTLVNVPTQTLIANRVAVEVQGRVYGAHFAWSHLWWALAYPLAGWLGSNSPTHNFFYTSLIGAGLLVLVYLAFKPWKLTDLQGGLWHEHEHLHDDEQHSHIHSPTLTTQSPHHHLHFHPVTHQ
ncbi:MFS transporter [Chamaesiphon sp. OTE_8_metabat_110]|uniref:MFS transporter n=1 Tax=Chamaesiphon sp. OTE_8_metabat_110 TaxID=2964696 RepID=UPI00286C2C5F|nr:MFS transporter [Chamaesiphon sp. OTE_8_metabat_110]